MKKLILLAVILFFVCFLLLLNINRIKMREASKNVIMNPVKQEQLIVEKLKKIDVNAKRADGRTALMESVERGSEQEVELLILKGADVNIKGDNGWTALMYGVGSGSKEMAALLISKGADVNAQADDGTTAVSIAKQSNLFEIVDILRKAGAKE